MGEIKAMNSIADFAIKCLRGRKRLIALKETDFIVLAGYSQVIAIRRPSNDVDLSAHTVSGEKLVVGSVINTDKIVWIEDSKMPVAGRDCHFDDVGVGRKGVFKAPRVSKSKEVEYGKETNQGNGEVHKS